MIKKIFLLTLILLPVMMYGQDPESVLRQLEDKNSDSSRITSKEDDEKIDMTLEGLEVIKIEEKKDTSISLNPDSSGVSASHAGDTTKIKLGEKNIQIFEEDNKTKVEIFDEKDEEENNDSICEDKNNKFKGHWAGIEIGLNNLFDNKQSLSRAPSEYFMELNSSRSINVNINFMQYSLGFANDRIGLVSGMGIEFFNYFFGNDNSIEKNNGYITSIDSINNLIKSKLTTSYLRIPLILELQLFGGERSKRFYISAGVVGAMKLGSHTKIVIREEGGKQKSKDNDDFYLNPFRWGLTSRIGFKGINLYADYYFTPLFQENKGPELYPFSVGFSFTF
jgi:hypothetical protein